jgi:hypothetical protein
MEGELKDPWRLRRVGIDDENAGAEETIGRTTDAGDDRRRADHRLERFRSRRDGEEVMGGPSEVRLDLHAIIDTLFLLKSDLQVYYWDHSGEGRLHERQRYQIAVAMRQVSERIVGLEDVVMHIGCPIVTVIGAGRESLRRAADLVDRYESIDEAERFEEVLCNVTAVLNAADVVCLRAAGGRPDGAARRDVARIERLARTDGSRAGVVVARIVPSPQLRSAEVEKNDGTPNRNVGS